jgi:Domain of unknown function (DUF4922)
VSSGNLLLSSRDLGHGLEVADLAAQTHALLEYQKRTWDLLRTGYESLKRVEFRSMDLDGFAIRLQFNPGRMTSSTAKVDARSISERPCFLCARNLPADQRALPFGDDFLILCNPFPIFPEHFTITHRDHTPQRIDGFFRTLLTLSRDLQARYTVLYNGPRCGASAPDHLHFQAGNKKFMPIDEEFPALTRRWGEILFTSSRIRVLALEDGLRKCIVIESVNEELLAGAFAAFVDGFRETVRSGDEEPMMNILSSYEEGKWRVVLFPRAKHRPAFYFAEGDRRILISPASVDLGGMCITPLREDFLKVTVDDLRQMFGEVLLSQEHFRELKDRVRSKLHA